MLKLGDFNLQFFFPGPGCLVLEPLSAAILKAGVAFLLELLYPLVDLLVADISSTVVGRASFMRLPPDIFCRNPLPLLYTFIQFLSCLASLIPYFELISTSDP